MWKLHIQKKKKKNHLIFYSPIPHQQILGYAIIDSL